MYSRISSQGDHDQLQRGYQVYIGEILCNWLWQFSWIHITLWQLYINIFISSKAQSRKDLWFFRGSTMTCWPVVQRGCCVPSANMLQENRMCNVTFHRINSTENVEPCRALDGLGQETDCKCSRRRKTVPEYLTWRGHRRKVRVRAFTLEGSRAECPGVAKFCQATQEAVPRFQNVGAQVCVLLRWCA